MGQGLQALIHWENLSTEAKWPCSWHWARQIRGNAQPLDTRKWIWGRNYPIHVQWSAKLYSKSSDHVTAGTISVTAIRIQSLINHEQNREVSPTHCDGRSPHLYQCMGCVYSPMIMQICRANAIFMRAIWKPIWPLNPIQTEKEATPSCRWRA